MSLLLRQSTASQEILLAPFLDSTDGNTQETALTIANTDIKIWKEGATAEVSKNSGGATHIASGRYYAVLDATDTNTLGKLEINVHVAGALAVRREFMVVPAVVYDAMILGTDNLDVTAVNGTITTLTNLPSIPAGWLTAAGIAAAALNGKGDWNIGKTGYSLAAGSIANATFAADTGLVTVRSNTAQAGAATSITLDASASAVTDFYVNDLVIITGGTGVGQGRYITAYNGTTKAATVTAWKTNPDATSTFAIIASDAVPGATAPTAAQVADAVWDEVLSGHLTAGSTGAALNAAGSAGDPWSTLIPGAYGAGTAGKILGDNINATISSRATQTSVDSLTTTVGAAGAGLMAVPWNSAWAVQVAGATWNAATASYGTAGTYGELMETNLDATITSVYNRIGAPAGASISADIAAVQSDTNDIQTRLPAALVGGRMDSNLSAISNSTTTMAAFNRAVKTNVIGTAGVGSTTTSIVTSAVTPAPSVADQLKGLVIKFADDTTTAALRGQATTITASSASATPTLTVTALTTAAASGDTFAIL